MRNSSADRLQARKGCSGSRSLPELPPAAALAQAAGGPHRFPSGTWADRVGVSAGPPKIWQCYSLLRIVRGKPYPRSNRKVFKCVLWPFQLVG